ncbi:AAA family ATPase [Marivita hallyeonensis]|uniref:Adenylate kinase n=1 Tax=Marivita hallyeonensis TaxID=996342 RepID=A0A1M5UBJ2_9RHOB|nr:AAA family ATPase [Marivita hallyeonensis]SHH60392.1 Adenylate kinase [Marivita hallyeonensis]
MNRVMILGQPGSGKSTLARIIGERTALPVVHVDRIHHLPGWQERPREEKIAMALEEQAKPKWVFEGGLSTTYADRFERADVVIWLDLPLGLRLWRVFWRTVRHHGKTRPDMQDDCPEGFHYDFYKWIWDTRHTGRLKALQMKERAAGQKPFYHLTSRQEIRIFLADLDAGRVSRHVAGHG